MATKKAKDIERGDVLLTEGGPLKVDSVSRGFVRYNTLEALRSLGPEPAPGDVDRVMGNQSWTTPPPCNECKASGVDVVMLGDEPDYESSTAFICGACLLKALQLVDQ